MVRTRSTCHETERNATKTKRNTKNSSKRGGRRVVESLTDTNLKFEIEIQLIESAPANRLLRSLGVVVNNILSLRLFGSCCGKLRSHQSSLRSVALARGCIFNKRVFFWHVAWAACHAPLSRSVSVCVRVWIG